jgi:D-tyrosyl-tRNA(Tyr) deacylase
MRVLIQKVSSASVTITGAIKSEIGQGLLILLGVENEDSQEDIDWLCKKIVNLRIFNDSDGKMNLSVQDIDGELLVVSQFTLFASTKKGNRPGFTRSAKPDYAIPMYEKFVQTLGEVSGKKIRTGEFGAMMDVALVNDGPVTIWMNSKNKE